MCRMCRLNLNYVPLPPHPISIQEFYTLHTHHKSRYSLMSCEILFQGPVLCGNNLRVVPTEVDTALNNEPICILHVHLHIYLPTFYIVERFRGWHLLE